MSLEGREQLVRTSAASIRVCGATNIIFSPVCGPTRLPPDEAIARHEGWSLESRLIQGVSSRDGGAAQRIHSADVWRTWQAAVSTLCRLCLPDRSNRITGTSAPRVGSANDRFRGAKTRLRELATQ
jgi:hypothetical protein